MMNNQEANMKIIELIKKSIELTTGLEAEAPTAYLMTEISVLKLVELLQSQSEPVGYIVTSNHDGRIFYTSKPVTLAGHKCEPLFTHPPLSVNEQLLKEVGELCILICNSPPETTIKGEIESRAYALGHFSQVIAIAKQKGE